MINSEKDVVLFYIIVLGLLIILAIYQMIKDHIFNRRQLIVRNQYSSYMISRNDIPYKQTDSYKECLRLLRLDLLCIPGTIGDDGNHITIDDKGLYRLLDEKYRYENQYFDDIVSDIHHQYDQLHIGGLY
jgi:hypothetical protein